VSSNHPDVLGRYSTETGGVTWFGELDSSGPDTIWSKAPSVNAGGVEQGGVSCTTSSDSFSASFLDVPATPVELSGATSFGDSPSEVWFNAPGEAQYVADLSLAGGALELGSKERLFAPQTFASSGEFQFGTLFPGDNELQVEALEGPQATWSVQIHALPVSLSGVAFEPFAVEPGRVAHLKYTTSGATSVTAVIQDSTGQVVRTLADELGVSRGDHTLTWDGRSVNGGLLSPGVYTAQVTTHDPSGEAASGQASLYLDPGPQTSWLHRPAKVTSHRTVLFAFGSSEPKARFECKVLRGWQGCHSPRRFHLRPGHYLFAVRAVDRYGIGDPTPAKWRFRVRHRKHRHRRHRR
jgi:FlgD Ig-like domain